MNWSPKKFHYKVILNYRINEKEETPLVRDWQDFCWWGCRGAKAWLGLTWVISCCKDGWNHKPTLRDNSVTANRCWETTLCYRLVKGCTLITESHLGLRLRRCCGAGHSGYRLKNGYQSQTPQTLKVPFSQENSIQCLYLLFTHQGSRRSSALGMDSSPTFPAFSSHSKIRDPQREFLNCSSPSLGFQAFAFPATIYSWGTSCKIKFQQKGTITNIHMSPAVPKLKPSSAAALQWKLKVASNSRTVFYLIAHHLLQSSKSSSRLEWSAQSEERKLHNALCYCSCLFPAN